MNPELNFEAMPFEIYSEYDGKFEEFQESDPELGSFEWEEEFGRRFPARRPGLVSRPPRVTAPRLRRPLPPGPKLPKKRPGRPPCPLGRRPCPPWGIVREPYGIVSEPYPFEPEPTGSEYVRWVQDCLNQALGLQLPLNGVMGPETRSAVRNFQRQQGLGVSGIVGPDTEEALKTACTGHVAHTMGSGRGIGSTAEEIGETLSIGPTGELVEEEYKITTSMNVSLITKERVELTSAENVELLSPYRGIYFINEGQDIRYVGKAEKSIKGRIKDRLKAFHDFGIPESTYYGLLSRNNTNVTSYQVRFVPPIRKGDKTREELAKHVLGALEEYFIEMHKTRNPPGRNRDAPRPVRYSGGAEISVMYASPEKTHDAKHKKDTLKP